MTNTDFYIFLPEILLATYAMIALMLGVFVKTEAMTKLIFNATAAMLLIIGALYTIRIEEGTLFNALLVDDAFGRYLKMVMMLVSAAILVSSARYLQRIGLYVMEYPVLIVLALLGMAIMVMANNILALYIGLELQSLALYVLAAFRRDNARSSEAGMKYFTLGALSSGLFLFGASLVYGFTGGLNYELIAASIGSAPNIGVVFGLAFLAAAIAFKISAAPFHMWTPDVYQGAPTSVTAFFATAPKLAVAAMLARLVYSGFADAIDAWQQILILLAFLSVFVGAIGGIAQKNIKRLLAYSSILNMGFVLMALASGTEAGLSSMLVYMTIYVVATTGSFAFVMSMERDGREVVEISELGQLSTRAPLAAAGLAVLMFSTAGIPPLAGFIGKYVAISAAVDAHLAWLAVAAVIASVIAAYYYLRLIYLAYFGDEPDREHERHWKLGQSVVFTISVVLMIVWMFKLFGIGKLSLAAAQSLMG